MHNHATDCCSLYQCFVARMALGTATMLTQSLFTTGGVLSCGVVINVISRKREVLNLFFLMHNCATFTAAVYINAL
jgi:hypothetical protein